LVEQITQRIHRKLEWARKAVHKQIQINLHMTSVNQRTQSLHAERWWVTTLIYTALEHNKKLNRGCLWGASNRCLCTRAPSLILCWGDGQD
jgi:hypothetical protein